MQEYTVVGISLPRKVVQQIDLQRGDVSRSRYLLRIWEAAYEIQTTHDELKKQELSQDAPKKVGHPGAHPAIVEPKPPLVVVKKDDKA